MTKEERTELIEYLKYNRSIGADYLITDKDADEIIKALEQEPYEDTNANQHNPNALNDVGQHKNALEEDAISRQAAIEAVEFGITYATGVNMETGEVSYPFAENNKELRKAISRICDLPSVTPKQRTGHNCNEDYADCDQFVCSECGIELQDWRRIERDEDDGEITCHDYVMKYCPNCGAKMVEPQESETGMSEEISREEIAALLARESEDKA